MDWQIVLDVKCLLGNSIKVKEKKKIIDESLEGCLATRTAEEFQKTRRIRIYHRGVEMFFDAFNGHYNRTPSQVIVFVFVVYDQCLRICSANDDDLRSWCLWGTLWTPRRNEEAVTTAGKNLQSFKVKTMVSCDRERGLCKIILLKDVQEIMQSVFYANLRILQETIPGDPIFTKRLLTP